MEELVKFYETSLIPHLKGKYGELMVIMAELEATIILKDGKIAQLEEKIKLLNSSSNIAESNNMSENVVKVGRKKKT